MVSKEDIEALLKNPKIDPKRIDGYRKLLNRSSTNLANLEATIRSQSGIPPPRSTPTNPKELEKKQQTRTSEIRSSPPVGNSMSSSTNSSDKAASSITVGPSIESSLRRSLSTGSKPLATAPQGAAISAPPAAASVATPPPAAVQPPVNKGAVANTTATSPVPGAVTNIYIGQPGSPTASSSEKPATSKADDVKTPEAKKPELPKSLPPLSVKPTTTPIAPVGATGAQKFKGAVGAVVQQNRERGDRIVNAAVALTSKSPAPGPAPPPGPAPDGGQSTALAAMGMGYGGPLAGMIGPANAGALLQAQGDFKQLLDARTLPITLMLPLIIALVAVILGFIVSVYYVILLIVMVIQQSAINAPLNIETVDYASIQSLTFFTPGQFNYTYFLLLPLVALGGIGIFTALATVTNPTKPIPREIKGLVFVIGLAAVIMFFLQYLIYQKVGKTITSVDKRLKFFNNYVCTKIYKNAMFLKQLETPQASIVGVHNTIQNSLRMLQVNTPVLDMAKSFFTLSMFYHYQKISLRNPIIFDAFNLFNTRTLLSRGCQPGAYLSRYGTYIEDITESLLRPQLPLEIQQTKSDIVNQAFILCNEWITNANGYANTIYPEDSFSSFVIMAILTIFIQMVPLYLIIKFYQEGQDATSRILRALMENLGVTATKAEQQTMRM